MADEKELVLGNKQLVSFFFVVLALCGVFFALGYMIGRNSTKAVVAGLDGNTASQAGDGQRTQESEPPRETAQADPGAASSSSAPAAVPEVAPPSAPPAATASQTQPAHDVPPPINPPSSKAATSKPVADTPKEAGQLIAPEPGAMYLQVGALHRADAETMVKTLREQNYPAVLATSSKPEFFRVLVGPYHQTAEVADTKARLKALGFADAFVMR
jgi:cell division septation protein DedD